MSFQWIFDNAESISISKRAVVAQSITRGNRVRTNKLGGQTWRFDVKLPDGMRWSTWRPYIEGSEALDRFTVDTISLNQSGYSYINRYQGDASPGNIQVTYNNDIAPTTLTLSSVSSINYDQYVFKQGDWLQLGNDGHVYSVISDVLRGNSVVSNISIPVNRPVIEAANASVVYTLKVGQDVTFDVICVEFPTWNIFQRDQISWSGNFVFYEVV
jgi:hypothetical protein